MKDPRQVRLAIRAGKFRGNTAGLAPGHMQGNVCITHAPGHMLVTDLENAALAEA